MVASRKLPPKLVPLDPVANLEQRFFYRIQEYLANRRNVDAEFTLPGLRGWMLSQTLPEPSASLKLVCLVVLSWTAICQVEAEPDREDAIREELARQIDYLDGSSDRCPSTLNTLLSPENRTDTYASLRAAAAPGSHEREVRGIPRFNAVDRSR